MLFARAEVGRWHREVVGSKMISKYEAVEKWDYLDTMGSQPIDAVAPSHFDKFIMFIRNDVSNLKNTFGNSIIASTINQLHPL